MDECRDISAAQLSTHLDRYVGVDFDFSDWRDEDLPSLPGRCVMDLGDWIESDDCGARERIQECEPGGRCLVLENVFTREECRRIIDNTEAVGYSPIGEARKGAISILRNNLWLQITDSGGRLGDEIWQRIRPHIAEIEELPGEEGLWKATGLNEHYRFAKYYDGHGFSKHIDRPTIFEPERCSIYTVNIYLNDLSEAQKGRTRFWSKPGGLGKPDCRVGGVAGAVALFKQAVVEDSPWHDGEELQGGVKYLMRTDVIFERQL